MQYVQVLFIKSFIIVYNNYIVVFFLSMAVAKNLKVGWQKKKIICSKHL